MPIVTNSMDWSDLAKSGLGAIVGFLLAQLVNLAKQGYAHWRRPILRIEKPEENSRLLRHGAEVGGGEMLDEEIYGFTVRNAGRTVATGVRFQVTSISIAESDGDKMQTVVGHSMTLAVHETALRRGDQEVTSIVPGAAVQVGLASWREGDWSVQPLTKRLPDYYEETCGTAGLYKFRVVAFDDSGHYVVDELDVRN